jgi:uroporphyrinogen-III synthase
VSVLAGKRIVVTRPRDKAEELCQDLEARGAVPILLPTIGIEPIEDNARLDTAIAQIANYDWIIFTSANGVVAFWQRLVKAGISAAALDTLSIAAIGPATASALRARGFKVRCIPDEFVAERIIERMGTVSGKRILLPRADIARKTVVKDLETQGALVDDIAVYRTVCADADPSALADVRAGVDVVTFTSSSTVKNFHAMFGGPPDGALIACIGPITARTASELGYPVDVLSEDYTTEGLLRALETHYTAQPIRQLT